MAVKQLGLVSGAIILFILASSTFEHVNGAFNIGAYFNKIQYRLTGNFQLVHPFPDGLLLWSNEDIWFSKKSYEHDWDAVQYKYMGGYGGLPVLKMLCREVVDVLKDVESILRDVVEALISVVRLIWCLILSMMQRDISHLERPMANMRSRFEVSQIPSKRERIEDRLLDSTKHEWQAWRCIKRGLETVLQVAVYFIKFFYYAGKLFARAIYIVSKTVMAIVHIPIPWLYISVDGTYCYQFGNLFSERLALGMKHTCTGVSPCLRFLKEANC